MKLFLSVFAASCFAWAAPGDLAEVKTVYILPMGGGLDQYLAVRLASTGTVQVVTDARGADAIFTDRIGTEFEKTMGELYGVKDSEKDAAYAKVGGAGRGKGAIFLVDRKTRAVIWSAYEPAKSLQPDDLNRTAEKIVSKLDKDRKGK